MAFPQRLPSRNAPGADDAQHRGLQAAEAEVEPAWLVGRRRSACVMRICGKSNARSFAGARRAIDRRPAGIPEAEQLGHLVVRLARRIVPRAAQRAVAPWLGHDVEARVPARDDEHDGRQRQRAVVEEQRLDVAGEVVHRHQRHAARDRQRLRERHADEQRSDQARPLRDGNRVDVVEGRRRRRRARARRRRRCRARAAARRARARRRPTRGGSRPATPRRSSGASHGRAGSSTSSTTAAAVSSQEVSMPRIRMRPTSRSALRRRAGVDGARQRGGSRCMARRKMPRSVMMPAIRRCGVTSNAGLRMSAPTGVSRRVLRCVTSRWSRSSIGMCAPSGVARSMVETGAAT